ncbi:MAG: radical SAM protein [Candidatus Aenigmatarchaeota archaeon]
MEVQEVKCKSILSDSNLYSVDYSINPYTGCQHSCRYCYAVYMKKFNDHEENWGSFVDVKVNAVEVLEKEVRSKQPGSVLLSSVTDPYQPLEKKYKLTRRILKILEENDFSVTILTKNSLVLRDLDVLKEFFPGKISVGFTVNFLDDKDRQIWEPNASPLEERLDALRELHEEGISTYVHVGPYLEGITNLEEIFQETRDSIYEFQIENLNTRRSGKIRKTVEENYPELKEKYSRILKNDREYIEKLKGEVEKLRGRSEIPIRLFID